MGREKKKIYIYIYARIYTRGLIFTLIDGGDWREDTLPCDWATLPLPALHVGRWWQRELRAKPARLFDLAVGSFSSFCHTPTNDPFFFLLLLIMELKLNRSGAWFTHPLECEIGDRSITTVDPRELNIGHACGC